MEALQEPVLVAMSRYCGSRGGEWHSATDEAEENKRLPDRTSASASGALGDLEAAAETSHSNVRLAVPSATSGLSPRQSPSEAFASASASLPLPSAAELEESAVATHSQTSSTPAGSKASDPPSSSSRSSLETPMDPSPVTPSVAPSPSPSPATLSGAPREQRFAHLLHLLVDVRDVGVQCAAELLARSAEKAHGQLFELYREMLDRVENLQPRRATAPQ